MRDWLRAMRPWTGLPYRLMDSGVAIGWVAFFWYIATDPSSSTTATLGDGLLQVFGPTTWGILLVVTAVYATITSGLSHAWLRSGYIALAGACLGWCLSLLVGIIVAHPDWQETGKTLGSAMWFGYAFSNLMSRAAEARDRQRLAEVTADLEGDA